MRKRRKRKGEEKEAKNFMNLFLPALDAVNSVQHRNVLRRFVKTKSGDRQFRCCIELPVSK